MQKKKKRKRGGGREGPAFLPKGPSPRRPAAIEDAQSHTSTSNPPFLLLFPVPSTYQYTLWQYLMSQQNNSHIKNSRKGMEEGVG